MSAAQELSEAFLRKYPDEGARLLERLASSEVSALLREVSLRAATPLVERMMPLRAAAALADVGAERAGPILESLPLDVAVALLRCLSPGSRERLHRGVREGTEQALRTLLQHPEGTAGALMDPRPIAVAEELTAEEALSIVRTNPEALRYYVYVVSRRGNRLVGIVSLRELMLADEKTPLRSVMERNVESLSVSDGTASIIAHPAWRRFPVLPVVDQGHVFVGILRYETLRRLESEGTAWRVGDPTLATVLGLGELCWIGFAGMLAGFASTVDSTVEETGERGSSS